MPQIILNQLVVGPFSVNCYLLGCKQSQKMVVIDPGDEVEKIWSKIKEIGYSPEYIINTHGHIDHIGGNFDLKQKSGAKILAHAHDVELMTNIDTFFSSMLPGAKSSPPPDELISDGQVIQTGELKFKVLHTPGHTQGGICLLVENMLFTGDTLFADSIGRTDFPGGDYQQLLSSIKDKLFPLDDQLRVLPGHGDETVLGREKQYNPFLKKLRR